MIMDTLGTLRKSLSRMLWSWGGVSSSSSWKTAKSHALNHPSKPTRFLVNHIDWKGRWKVVWNLVQYSWKSNRANQGFWQKRCLMETQGVQWACGLRMVGTCYLEIGKGSPEPREANPCWLHVTTWDFFWDNFEITNSIKFPQVHTEHFFPDRWIEGQTSSLQLWLDSIAPRCAASQVQLKVENAGRYLPLVLIKL